MHLQSRIMTMGGIVCTAVLFSGCTQTYSVDVDSSQKISAVAGNLANILDDGDQFGRALANLGDIESDGVIDLAVGAPFDDDNGTDQGSVYILFMDTTGEVDVQQKISETSGNFTGVLDSGDRFGTALARLGDLNGDGFTDIAVGAPGDDDGGTDRGAIWILNLDAQGRVLAQQKISQQAGNFAVNLDDGDEFGAALAAVGDINRDGIVDLAVGVPGDDDGGSDRGAIWILFMNNDGTVNARQKIGFDTGSFNGNLHDGDHFGVAITELGDLDGNGIPDLVAGASGDDDGGANRGAVWLLLMQSNGTVSAAHKISQNEGEFDDFLADGEQFGSALANLGDLNNDGIPELGAGSEYNDDGGVNRGALRVLFLRKDHTVISSSRISDILGDFTETLDDGDQFGTAITSLGDLDRDGSLDIATSALLDDDGGTDRGAAWILFMRPVKVGLRIDKDADLAAIFSGRGY